MARAHQKRSLIGFRLEFNRTGNKGLVNWSDVGVLFSSFDQANAYVARHLVGLPPNQVQIRGVRVNIESAVVGVTRK